MSPPNRTPKTRARARDNMNRETPRRGCVLRKTVMAETLYGLSKTQSGRKVTPAIPTINILILMTRELVTYAPQATERLLLMLGIPAFPYWKLRAAATIRYWPKKMAEFMSTICHVVSKGVTEISMEVGPPVKNFMIGQCLNALYF
jgi:hypothetical protein